MNFIERVGAWLGINLQATPAHPSLDQLQTTLEKARRFKRSGQYEQAILELNSALTIAQGASSSAPMLITAIHLHRVDVLIRLNDLDQAEQILDDLEQDAIHHMRHEAQLAYVMIGRGILAQAKNQWDEARTLYQSALDKARGVQALGAEGRAAGHLADVYLHEGNASYAAHLLQESLPKLNASGDMEMSSYFVGLLGKAMIQNGNVSEGHQVLGQALRLAEHMEYRDYEILWRTVLATEAMKENLFEEARRHLLLVLAHISVGVYHPDHLLTLCRISKACHHLGEAEAALDYAKQAISLLTDNSQRESFLLAHGTLGVAIYATGDFENGIHHLQLAADGYDALTLTAAEYSYVELLRTLGAAQTELGQYDAAQATYDLALKHAEQKNLTVDSAGIQRDIGLYYVRKSEYSQAIQTWLNALRLYEAQGLHAQVARLYCDIANVRRQIGQSKRAMKDYEQALMLLSAVKDADTRGIVLSNAAIAYVDYGDIATAEAFFLESIQLAQKNRDAHAEATRRGNYGWFLLNTGRPKAALEMLEYAVRQSENLGMTLQAAVQTDNLGLVWDELHDDDKALTYHTQAWDKLQQLAEINPDWQAMISANRAHTLISKGDIEDAEIALNAALTIGRQFNRYDVIIRALNGLVRIHLLRDSDVDALPVAQEAVQLAEQQGGRRLLAESLIVRSEVYARLNQMENAQSDWQTATESLRILRLNSSNYQPEWIK
jgi:tetratricopeptide (TPR) repeat protein